MISIDLGQGRFAIIDDCDSKFAGFGWRLRKDKKRFYAYKRVQAKRHTTYYHLHRFILEEMIGRPLREDELPDHIDGDGLNNRRSNLRVATRAQNAINTGLHPKNTSGFKGVSFVKKTGRWSARIRVNGKRKFLGTFETRELANAEYQKAAEVYHKDFAKRQSL